MQNSSSAVTAEHTTDACDVAALNALLRGEVAAVEAYDRVIAKFSGQPQAIELHRLRDEHGELAALLRERVRQFGGDPSEGSGAWGKLTAAITGAAKVFGAAAALAVLRQGEEFGIGQYENALADSAIDAADKELIRFRLLPRAQAHSSALEAMIEAAKE